MAVSSIKVPRSHESGSKRNKRRVIYQDGNLSPLRDHAASLSACLPDRQEKTNAWSSGNTMRGHRVTPVSGASRVLTMTCGHGVSLCHYFGGRICSAVGQLLSVARLLVLCVGRRTGRQRPQGRGREVDDQVRHRRFADFTGETQGGRHRQRPLSPPSTAVPAPGHTRPPSVL